MEEKDIGETTMTTGVVSEDTRKRRIMQNRNAAKRSEHRNQRKASPRRRDVSDGAVVATLDDDVTTEILLLMPVTCLMRYQLVCKSWRSIISAARFRRLHSLRRLHEPQRLVLVTRYSPTPVITKEKAALLILSPITKTGVEKMCAVPIVDLNNSEILSCSNGLMLLRFQYDPDGYYLHNAATRQTKPLGLAYHEIYTHVVSIHILFDPSSLNYKIVCVRAKGEPVLKQPQSYLIEVFSSENRKWRVCVGPFVSAERMKFSDCLQCNDSVYLIHRNHCGDIYSFNIAKNVSRLAVFAVPLGQRSDFDCHIIQGWNDHIYYCTLVRNYQGERTPAVWELEVKEEDPAHYQWWLMLRRSRPRRLPGGSKLLRFDAGTNTLLIQAPKKIVACNYFDGSYKEVLDLDAHACANNIQPGNSEADADVYEFGETLALL